MRVIWEGNDKKPILWSLEDLLVHQSHPLSLCFSLFSFLWPKLLLEEWTFDQMEPSIQECKLFVFISVNSSSW